LRYWDLRAGSHTPGKGAGTGPALWAGGDLPHRSGSSQGREWAVGEATPVPWPG